MPAFTVAFTPPDPPASFSATADAKRSAIELRWDAFVGVDFLAYRVFRTIADGERVLLATLTPASTELLVDYLAPIGSSILYEVTIMQTTGAESEPAAAETALAELGWWIVRPGVDAETFRLAHVEGYDDVEPIDEERHAALGRPRKIVVQGERYGKEGTLRLRVAPADRDVIEKLRLVGDLAHAPVLLLKSPFGEIYQVAIGNLGRARGGAGHQVITVPYVEVGPRISDQTPPLGEL